MLDFTLFPLTYLEETFGAVVSVEFNGLEIDIPYNWHIMISDPETQQLDFIQIVECAANNMQAVAVTPDDGKFRLVDVKIKKVIPQATLVHPMMQKAIAMMHPIGDAITDKGINTTLCIVIGPHDLHKHVMGYGFGDIT
jgi:hypothetical protein